jgi:mercuric ion binding protein
MRKIRIAFLAAFLPLPALAAPPQTIVLNVQNMTCSLCPVTVKKSLEKVSGVSQVQINLDAKTAKVTFDADKAAVAALVQATTDAGFPSTVRK